MLNKKIFLILFLFVIGIVALSAVSANDSTDGMLNNVSCDEIGINEGEISQNDVEISELESDEVLSSPDSGTFSELQSKINGAGWGGTIKLENDYHADGSKVPTISRDLTINGNGKVIDGLSQSALFRVLGNVKVTLNNITFKNGNDSEVIRVDHANSVVFNDCQFESNLGYYGGAMYVSDTKSVTFNNCNFLYNSGNHGGGLEMTDVASASFNNCYFVGNFAHTGGAIHMFNVTSSSLSIANFGFNIAEYGGAIYMLSCTNFNLVTGLFINNTVNGTGGAIYCGESKGIDLYDTYISNNSAFFAGGIFVSDSSDFNLQYSTLEYGNAHYGGAIILSGYDGAYISNCDFIGNDVMNLYDGSTAGAIYIEKGKKLRLLNSHFEDNTAVNGGAIYLENSYDSVINHCVFESNYGLQYGGAVHLRSNVNGIELTDTNFTANFAFWGGAIYALTVENGKFTSCYFRDNQAVASGDEAGAGGAAYISESYAVDFNSCTFEDDYAKHLCGAVSLLNSNEFNFNNCKIIGCYAPNCGGIAVVESTATFNKCEFINNTASEYVGALVKGTAIDCTFIGNSYPQTYQTHILSSLKLTVSQSGSTSDDKVIIATVTNANDGSAVSDQNVKFNLNGQVVQVKTNALGQAVIKPNLASRSYPVTVTVDGSNAYVGTSANVNMVVNKATPKLLASNKNFKLKVKTKKYTVTLKNSQGNAIINAPVKIKVKNKVFSAKTNANGKATFKLKLNKKGTYKSTVTFAGNGYYNAVSKKVTIKVKK